MKKLNKTQATEHARINDLLHAKYDELTEGVQRYNTEIKRAFGDLEPLLAAYNEALETAQGFVEEIHNEAQTFADERSEKWQESDAGQAHDSWRSTWESYRPEEIEIAEPDEADEPDEEGVSEFEALPLEVE